MDINGGQKLIRTMYREYLSSRKGRDYLPLVPTCENLVLQTCFLKEIDNYLGSGYESLSDLERINLFFLHTDIVVTHTSSILGYTLETASQELLYSLDTGLMHYSDIESISYIPVLSDSTLTALEVVPFYFTRFENNLSNIRVSSKPFNLANRDTYSNIVVGLVKKSLVDNFRNSEYLCISREFKGTEGLGYFRLEDDVNVRVLSPEIRVLNVNDIPTCIDITTIRDCTYVPDAERSLLTKLRGTAKVITNSGSFLATTSREMLGRCKGNAFLRVLEDYNSKVSILSSSLYKRYQVRRDTLDFESFDTYESYTNYKLADSDWRVASFSAFDTVEDLVLLIVSMELSSKYNLHPDTSIKMYRLDEGREGIVHIQLSNIISSSRIQLSNQFFTYIASGVTSDYGLQTLEVIIEGTSKPTYEEIVSASERAFSDYFGGKSRIKGISTFHGRVLKGRTDIVLPFSLVSEMYLNIVYSGYKRGYRDYEKQVKKLLELNEIRYKISSHCIKLLCMNKVASISRHAEDLCLNDLVDVLYEFISLALEGEMELNKVYNSIVERRAIKGTRGLIHTVDRSKG